MRSRARWAAAAVIAALTGACTTPLAEATSWSAVPLPDGAVAVTVTAYEADLLVGTHSSADPPAPGLLRRQGQSWQPLPVRPTSGYARQATWLSIQAEADGSLVAVGGARGGAHSNVRWTVWRGAPGDGLTEEPQAFEVFGGWGAGDQLAVVATASGPMLVGSWQSAQSGLDVAVWLARGQAWVRQPAAGTARESRPDLIAGPRSATDDGAGAVVVGSVLALRAGSVLQTPAVWTSERGDTGWRRIDLPSGGQAGEAASATCTVGSCAVVGWVGEQVAVWRLEAGVARRVEGLTSIPATSGTPIIAAARSDGRTAVLVGQGSGSVLVTEGSSGWTSRPGPAGNVTAFAVAGPSEYAVTSSVDGTVTLWCFQDGVDGGPGASARAGASSPRSAC
ncbi:MAG: hypothetical protein V9G08_04230 [Dermatophilaceae bacterium]